MNSYLLNGNILAARTFITQFSSQITSKRPELVSTLQSAPIPIGTSKEGQTDEIIFTTDSVLNFTQLAVRTCQRAQGAQNKAMREAWVRLCGTYQSKGGLMGTKEVRKVRTLGLFSLFGAVVPLPDTSEANGPALALPVALAGRHRAPRGPRLLACYAF